MNFFFHHTTVGEIQKFITGIVNTIQYYTYFVYAMQNYIEIFLVLLILISVHFYRPEAQDENDRILRCCAEFRQHLENLNQKRTSEIQAHLIQAVECCLGTIR